MSALEFFRGNDPFSPFTNDPFFRRMDRLWQDVMSDFVERSGGSEEGRGLPLFRPACDVDETDKEYVLNFDVPGLKKEDIDIEVEGNVLRVSGERKRETNKDDRRSRTFERSWGRFERVFTLPDGLSSDEVRAHYENGVLQLVVPKTERQMRKRIDIKEGTLRLENRGEGKSETSPASNPAARTLDAHPKAS